jgi:DNA mismatch repair protein MutL
VTVRLLEEHVVNQIAAGEVIERPASVVKELVENSLDAGASTLEVLLVDGGKQRIRVRDDGHGMPEADAMMSLERHATSKIRRAEDLTHVGTLGFRGEALPSIAAVSRFSLVTRSPDEEEAVRVRVEGGTLTDVRRVGAPAGTEIDVRSLFFNVPARQKFLRTRGTELSHCMETLVRMALMRPDVDLTVRHGDREVLRAPRGDLQRRAVDALGKEARSLVPVAVARDGIEVTGLASLPGRGRSSAAGALYLYVNGRWVRDIVLRRAIYQAYRDLMPKGRYPLVVLDVRVPPGGVDVNVHPTKAEVRFVRPREVTATLAEGLRAQILAAGNMSEPRHRPERGGYRVDKASLPLRSPAPWALPSHPDDDPRAAAPPVAPPPVEPSAPVAAVPPPAPLPASPPPMAHEAEPAPVVVGSGPSLRALPLVGVARRRWVLLESPGGLVVVDGARAALRYALRQPAGAARLLVPARVAVTEGEADALMQAEAQLDAAGLSLARFGPREVAVKAVPPALVSVAPEAVVEQAVRAVRSRADLLVHLADTLEPPPLDEVDELTVRTLLASLEEAGIDVAARSIGWGEL